MTVDTGRTRRLAAPHVIPRPRPAAVLVAVAVALTCGACTIATSDADRAAATARANATALRYDPRTEKVTLDLREPPTPTSIGMAPGQEVTGVQRDVGGMLDVDVLLPNGHHLHVPAFAVNIALGPNTLPRITINRRARDLDDADRTLRGHAGPLRLNRDKLDVLLGQMHNLPPEMYGADDNFFLESGLPGYLRLSVELRHSTQSTTFNYIFFWDDLTDPVLHPKTPNTKPTTPHTP